MMSDKPTLRVLVLWCDNQAANYGLRVLAKGNEELVRSAFPAWNVVVDFQDFGPGDSTVSFGTRSIIKDILRPAGPIKTKLKDYDLILDSGAGDSFADIYGFKRLSFIVYAHSVIRKLGLPLVLAPQTIGPFNTRLGRFVARRTLNQAALVLARDAQSSGYSRHLGRPVDKTTTDVVFALSRTEKSVLRRRDVLLNVSGLLWFGDDHVSSREYRAATKKLVTELIRSGREVAIVPHVVKSRSGNDDVDAATELVKDLQAESGVTLEVLVPSDLSEVRDTFASANLVIGARMHACLNALSMGTPAIPWAYSRKFKPLMSDIGWDIAIDLRSDPDPAKSTLELIHSWNLEIKSEQLAEVRRVATYRLEAAATVVRASLGEMMTDA